MESIPQIPIHVTEIKKLIIKDNLNSKSTTSDNDLDEDRLLSVLTHGSTGRNPTFFKAYGHNDVFGLRVAIPEGCTTIEVAENLPSEDPCGIDEGSGLGMENQNVLYVQLPEGHPVITGADQTSSQVSCNTDAGIPSSVITTMSSIADNSEPVSVVLSGKSAAVQPSLSFEEAVEQAELIFDDGENVEDIVQNNEEEVNTSNSNLLSSSSKITASASAPTANPDLKSLPVLSATKEPKSNISTLLPEQNLTLTTAAPVNNLDTTFVSRAGLEEQDTKHGRNVLEVHSEKVVDNLSISHSLKEAQKSKPNKIAVTIVQIPKQTSVSNDNIDNARPDKANSMVQNDNMQSERHQKDVLLSRFNAVTTAPKTKLTSVMLEKDNFHEQTRKDKIGNPATEIISITPSIEGISPVNKSPKSNNEFCESKKRKDESIAELEVLSNSVMEMANVEDEIEADGANNYNNTSSDMSMNKPNFTGQDLVNTAPDSVDGKEKHAIVKEDIPLQVIRTESVSENSRHHNLRPKRTLRHVHALKQQAKRRKRNTSIAAAAASGGTSISQTVSNVPDPATISIQRTAARKSSIGRDNGGK